MPLHFWAGERGLPQAAAPVGSLPAGGIGPAAVSLSDTHAAVLALQAGMLARAKAYGEAVMQARRLGDAAMAEAAAADLVPAGILADDIEDRDGDASALRGSFAA